MSRIGRILAERLDMEKVRKWIDVGTGDGRVVMEIPAPEQVERVAVDVRFPTDCALSPRWTMTDDLDSVIAPLPPDLITALDVVEHLDKNDSRVLVATLLATPATVVIFTPRGFLRQDRITHPEEVRENPAMEHLCGWEPAELRALGFEVEVLRDFHDPKGVPGKWDALLAVRDGRSLWRYCT